ncbi:MAG TPA: peptidoglycan DD-metalloendopeptidase family protein [Candidatus Gastranaerophilales bacterium]|nr:peptidoglycan DD-metalloendopeptidase family protein [Candidatus Gastranaerophilales bacterium]
MVLILLISITFNMPVKAFLKLDVEKEKIEIKIKELKQKEAVEIKKLTVTQKNLEKTETTIKHCENKLISSKINMSKLENRLTGLEGEQKYLSQTVEKRIRQIYKGERIGIFHVVFASQDISTFFDRLYYQKTVIKKDKELLENLKRKSEEIKRSQMSIAYEKNNIASSLQEMNQKKANLDSSLQTTQYLINKLRTDRKAYEQAQSELASLSRDIEKNISRSASIEKLMDSVFIRPIAGVISSPFGWRRHPIFGSTRFHSGVDIAGPNNAAIKASNSGKVIYSGWYGGYGKVVIVNHGTATTGRHQGQKVSTLYAHMSTISVNVGDYIKKGQVVGREGSTGYSTGPHLHFEVRINGKPMNPLSFI